MKLQNIIAICICLVAYASCVEDDEALPEASEVDALNTTLNYDNATIIGTDNDIIIIFSTPLHDNNSTNGTESTLTDDGSTTTTVMSTTVDEDISVSNDTCVKEKPECLKTNGTCEVDSEDRIICRCPEKKVYLAEKGCIDVKEECAVQKKMCQETKGFCNVTTEGQIQCFCPKKTDYISDKGCKENVCLYNPCRNGGTCKEISSAPFFSCACPVGYDGIQCGTADRCIYDEDGHPCGNGYCAYSTDGREKFCDCFPGYYWDNNTSACREIKTCHPNPCKHGGQCNLLSRNQYNCSCESGFSGQSCEITDWCVTNEDCGPGNCILSGDQVTRRCKCADGFYPQYSPHTCIRLITRCDLYPCHNGGSCMSFNDNTYNCTCEKGFVGYNCEIEEKCVTNEDCEHGICTFSEEDKTRSCKCSDGFYLQKSPHTCKKITNACQRQPCMNGGICDYYPFNSSISYVCSCWGGYTGKNCEVRDMCVRDGGDAFCGNATCQNNYELGIYYCTCPEGKYFQYNGRMCVEADLCPLMQCESNERCLYGKCGCKENYEYKNSTGSCEPNFCSKNPCPVPDMICTEGTGPTDYTCSCQEGYSFNGIRCHEASCIFPQLNPCQQLCTVKDSGYECSCDEDFKLRDDNKTCELKGNNTCQVKVCDKGSCVVKSSEEFCICPPGYIEIDGNCTDKCSADSIDLETCPDGCELTEGGFRCECRGKIAYSGDKTTCVVRNVCQENEVGWKRCSERNAVCLQNWNKTEGFICKCRKGQVEMFGICEDVCNIESNQKMCYLKGGTCDIDGNGNVTCRCPPYFQMNEKDGKCNEPADTSYLITLPLDLSTYTMANRKRRSLDTSVDYRKISRDVKITIAQMFVGYKQSNILYCTPTSDYILCKIELQIDNSHETQLRRLRTEDLCLTDKDAKKCLLPPALVLVKERISEDTVIVPTDPCEDFIKEEICGSETTCVSVLSKKSFDCTCKPGFAMRSKDYSYGDNIVVELCREVDECIEDNPCGPNSKCLNSIGSYSCTCLAGFRRDLSTEDLNCVGICDPNPCTHGLCSTRGHHDFDCKCDAGYRGAFCDLQDENYKRERNNSIILGVVLGGILLITFILFAVCVSRLRKRKCMESSNDIFYGSTEMPERGRINNAFKRE